MTHIALLLGLVWLTIGQAFGALDLGLEIWELLMVVGGISMLWLERRESRNMEDRIASLERSVMVLSGYMDPRLTAQDERIDTVARETTMQVETLTKEWTMQVETVAREHDMRTDYLAKEVDVRMGTLEEQTRWLRDVVVSQGVAEQPESSEPESSHATAPPSSAGSAWPATR